jgi:hypothetical protein
MLSVCKNGPGVAVADLVFPLFLCAFLRVTVECTERITLSEGGIGIA